MWISSSKARSRAPLLRPGRLWRGSGKGTGGKYLENCQVAQQVKENGTPQDPGHAKHA